MTEPHPAKGELSLRDLRVSGLYILDDDGTPVPCPDIEQWAEWFAADQARRFIAVTRIGAVTVSTIFLGVARVMPPQISPRPYFYETRVLRGFFAHGMLMAHTRDGALAAHEHAVDAVTCFSFIPAFIQDGLRNLHYATTRFRFLAARTLRVFLSPHSS